MVIFSRSRTKRAIIVGGGLAGLSAGVYAQRSGFESTVFELHERPGGVCTSWKRGPYTMDVGIRMVIGSHPDSPFHELYREVGIVPRVDFVPMSEFHCVEDDRGRRLHFPRDVDDLAGQMATIAPRDGVVIRRFVSILTDFARFRPRLDSSVEIKRVREGLRSMVSLRPVWRHFVKYWKVPLVEWTREFESRDLGDAFLRIYPIVDFPVLAMFSSLGWFTAGHVGRPAGGAQAIADAVADEYRQAGGDLRLSSRVARILVREGRARGVRLEDGTEHLADVVVGAGDGRSLIFDLLEGRFADDGIHERYRSLPVFNPLVMVQLGVERDMSGEPESLYFPVRPMQIFGRTVKHLNVHHSTGGMAAPAGHSVVRVGIETDYDPWARLIEDREAYRDLKHGIAEQVVERLEQRHPGFSSQVRVQDVATPLTMERYTMNWRGAYEGWRPSTATFGLRMGRTLPGLGNFYMTGQWVEPGGGIPGVVFSARHTMQLVAHEQGGRPVW